VFLGAYCGDIYRRNNTMRIYHNHNDTGIIYKYVNGAIFWQL